MEPDQPRTSTYRQSLHEGTELAHELRQVPALDESRSKLEGNTEESEDNIREGEVGDIEVRHGMHPSGDQHYVHHQAVPHDGNKLDGE